MQIAPHPHTQAAVFLQWAFHDASWSTTIYLCVRSRAHQTCPEFPRVCHLHTLPNALRAPRTGSVLQGTASLELHAWSPEFLAISRVHGPLCGILIRHLASKTQQGSCQIVRNANSSTTLTPHDDHKTDTPQRMKRSEHLFNCHRFPEHRDTDLEPIHKLTGHLYARGHPRTEIFNSKTMRVTTLSASASSIKVAPPSFFPINQ